MNYNYNNPSYNQYSQYPQPNSSQQYRTTNNPNPYQNYVRATWQKPAPTTVIATNDQKNDTDTSSDISDTEPTNEKQIKDDDSISSDEEDNKSDKSADKASKRSSSRDSKSKKSNSDNEEEDDNKDEDEESEKESKGGSDDEEETRSAEEEQEEEQEEEVKPRGKGIVQEAESIVVRVQKIKKITQEMDDLEKILKEKFKFFGKTKGLPIGKTKEAVISGKNTVNLNKSREVQGDSIKESDVVDKFTRR